MWDGTRLFDVDDIPGNYFNPPIPCGMGRISCRYKIAVVEFQSTHPVWDGTCLRGSALCALRYFNPPIPCGMGRSPFANVIMPKVFQSTHPVWDGTSQALSPKPRSCDFNPPIPCGMGLKPIFMDDLHIVISIHPSRVGWDEMRGIINFHACIFQSTHPVWDGTYRRG